MEKKSHGLLNWFQSREWSLYKVVILLILKLQYLLSIRGFTNIQKTLALGVN